MYNQYISLQYKWYRYTLTMQGSRMNAMRLVAINDLETCPWMKKELVLSSGVSIFTPSCQPNYSDNGRDAHTLMHVVHHHDLSDRIRLYILYREEDYFVTTLQHGPSSTPGFDVLHHKDIIYCTITLGRVIQKTVEPRSLLSNFVNANTAIARRSIEGERKSRDCCDRVKISEQFNNKKCS